MCCVCCRLQDLLLLASHPVTDAVEFVERLEELSAETVQTLFTHAAECMVYVLTTASSQEGLEPLALEILWDGVQQVRVSLFSFLELC